MLPLLAIATLAGPSNEPNRCMECHPPNVAGHLNDWDHSVHARAGITCHTCHPTDRNPLSHQSSDELSARSAAIIHTCNACHSDVTNQFAASQHHASERADKPTCATCHSTAGGAVLDAEALASRCRQCHAEPRLQQALHLLQLFRQVTIAHSLVRQAIDQRRKRGDDITAYEKAMATIDASYNGVALEWHRFNLDTAENHCDAALSALDALNNRLVGN